MTAPSSTPPDAGGGDRFVVQRHRASRLHYDVRLELDGTLVSWAVPKGPTLDPGVRRLAVRVGDHDLDYFDFEGVIGGAEYGAGDVTVWDWGTWSAAGKPAASAQLADGDLHVDLVGEKLRGRFVFVNRPRSGENAWLLIKKDDDAAVRGWEPEAHPTSVKTGRTNEEVAAQSTSSGDPPPTTTTTSTNR